MKNYLSVTHISSNENGEEELVLESHWNWLETLAFCFSEFHYPVLPPTKKEHYIARGTFWVEKETGVKVDSEMQFELFECKGWVKQNTWKE